MEPNFGVVLLNANDVTSECGCILSRQQCQQVSIVLADELNLQLHAYRFQD